ncbi:signal recognition particle-docking protein FtsY [Candidatus Woesearchaeota archaeon]|jgi:fused signal recognition particle receptor|nr:signal recognition particle-docking protein FtsY [Candidatus Woesearchaeota archaeon]MBT6044545.1 signal recognition particle-docking protein FtsY [Candidatus Woesearchaeota archaeon]
MFKFLKNKVKDALDKISKKVEDEVPDEVPEVLEEAKETKKEESKENEVKPTEVKEVKSKGIISKIKKSISTKKISESKFEELFSELEMALLENNVALDVIDKIKKDLIGDIVDKPIKRNEVTSKILNSLMGSIESLFDVESVDVVKEIKNKSEKPYVICFVGVNGCGKTTTIAKVANYLKKNKLNVLMVAGDTWRAASIQQLEEHGKNLDIRVIKHNYGSDPAAVAFDGIKAAKSNNVDVVLIDTAGRQHSNKDLMRELEKIVRVSKPDLNVFVGESITGNDCVLQAKQFGDVVDLGGVVLTKADVDEKGGAAVSVGYVTGKPILFLGKGQEYEDLEVFNKKSIMDSLGI